MARSGLIFGSVCILLSGMCVARPQAQVSTGISTKAPAGATTSPVPVKRPSAAATRAIPKKSGIQKTSLKTAPVVAPPPPSSPPPQLQPPPLRPEQMPPVQPKVSWQNGMLSVQAPNSTLSDILSGIRKSAGIQFEGLQGSSADRVSTTLGPAPADQILEALLRGSRFDYVIIATPDDPDIVQRVILTPRSGGAGTAVAGTVPPSQARPQQRSEDDDEDQAPAETVQAPPQQPTAQPQPGDAPKTTQQLVEELQRMQQQQQQQQNNPEQSPLKPGAPQPQQGAPVIRPKLPPL